MRRVQILVSCGCIESVEIRFKRPKRIESIMLDFMRLDGSYEEVRLQRVSSNFKSGLKTPRLTSSTSRSHAIFPPCVTTQNVDSPGWRYLIPSSLGTVSVRALAAHCCAFVGCSSGPLPKYLACEICRSPGQDVYVKSVLSFGAAPPTLTAGISKSTLVVQPKVVAPIVSGCFCMSSLYSGSTGQWDSSCCGRRPICGMVGQVRQQLWLLGVWRSWWLWCLGE